VQKFVFPIALAVAVVFGIYGYSIVDSRIKLTDQTLATSNVTVDLPNDGEAYYLSVFVHDDYMSRQSERHLVASFDTDPQLRSLKAQCHWHVYTPSDPIYKDRFSAVTTFPCILLQSSKGEVLVKASGANATNPVTLFNNKPWLRVRPWLRPRPCPPCPEPQPLPQPSPQPDLTPNPDTTPIDEVPPFPWLLLVLAVLLAGGISFAVNWTRRTT
jgi:hypothetical protein